MMQPHLNCFGASEMPTVSTATIPDEKLDELREAKRYDIAIEHLRRFWARTSCRCSICVSCDRRLPRLVRWNPHDKRGRRDALVLGGQTWLND
jgi:hypothetical protein